MTSQGEDTGRVRRASERGGPDEGKSHCHMVEIADDDTGHVSEPRRASTRGVFVGCVGHGRRYWAGVRY